MTTKPDSASAVPPHSLPLNRVRHPELIVCRLCLLSAKGTRSNPYSRALDLPGGVSKQPVARIPAEGHSSAWNGVAALADLKEMRERWH
jgi:hypothetical protein